MGSSGRDTRRKKRKAKKEKNQCEYRKPKFTDIEIMTPLGTFFGVFIINFALWVVLSPINQSEVALYATSKFLALVVTIIEAVILLYLVATNERKSATRLIIGTLIIASLLMSFFRFTNEKITEEGYSFISPISSYTLLWEDMVFYESYDADSNTVKLPFLKQAGNKGTWVGFSTTAYSSWSNDEYPRRIGWDLIEFRTITDLAKQKYGSREEFLDDIFLNRYGHLEAEWSREERAYVFKNGEIAYKR
ncbi:MAG: hypothetical protein IKT62_02915 [Firmicutes bacterium]|nr:hypothetical protein [Bacillota bacterium]